VLAWLRNGEVNSAVLAADGSVSGAGNAGGPASPLMAEGEVLAARYPAWAAIRGGTRLPLQGNLANLNILLADVSLLTIGVETGEGYAVNLTAQCPSDARAQHFEGSLRSVLLLLAVGPTAQVRRDGTTVRASMKVPAEAIG
jgi:hypothetical protein